MLAVVVVGMVPGFKTKAWASDIIASHPFAKNAKGWGTRHSICDLEVRVEWVGHPPTEMLPEEGPVYVTVTVSPPELGWMFLA
jgi:hypothetical protein